MSNTGKAKPDSFLKSRTGVALLVFLVIAGYFLWTEHRAHLIGSAPLLLFLGVCIGMHFFMHGGHGHGGHTAHSDDPDESKEE